MPQPPALSPGRNATVGFLQIDRPPDVIAEQGITGSLIHRQRRPLNGRGMHRCPHSQSRLVIITTRVRDPQLVSYTGREEDAIGRYAAGRLKGKS